ncbi:HAD family hydrolase [Thioalkalivibrio sp. ALJT]|uniref:HAD family hydrolase n=1 Tax=Thioalkalivibrio sp. ALJT TaxID=1158146 RepID=UPI0003721746|nr:HAD family hydrolase [Thioalkalivibrio sp. ALJT]
MDYPAPLPVALFDFDGTLSRRDSLFPFLRFVLGTPLFAARLPACLPPLLGMAAGRLSRQAAKERVLTRMLGGRALADLEAQAQAYAAGPLDRLLRPAGMQRLQWHQARGDTCVLVSASPELYLRPWARRHGIDHVIGSRLAVDAVGRITGQLEGANCQGAAKPPAITAWRAQLGPQVRVEYVAAYGDTAGDRHMLALAREGYLWRAGAFQRVFAAKEPDA